MPRKSDKIKLPSEYDRRRKLSDEDYKNIKNLYASGMSQRAIGRFYKVDHTTIAIIVVPTSDTVCIASDIIAPLFANNPAKNLSIARRVLLIIVIAAVP